MMNNKQFKIDRHQLAIKILKLMYEYRTVAWNLMILMYEFKKTNTEIMSSIGWLVKNGYVERRGQYYFGTKIGYSYYEDEVAKISLSTAQTDRQFRDEALTGMDASGNKSELEWAALPSSENKNRNPEIEMIQKCTWVDKIKMVAQELNISPQEARKGIEDGLIARCPGFPGVIPHWGKFHRDNSPGHERQRKCIECRKKLRKR